MSYAHKVDGNQADIVARLRAAGRCVEVMSDVGRGVPDLMVHWAGRCILMEVKMPGKGLTPAQMQWHAGWKGPAIAVVRCWQEALEATGIKVRD